MGCARAMQLVGHLRSVIAVPIYVEMSSPVTDREIYPLVSAEIRHQSALCHHLVGTACCGGGTSKGFGRKGQSLDENKAFARELRALVSRWSLPATPRIRQAGRADLMTRSTKGAQESRLRVRPHVDCVVYVNPH